MASRSVPTETASTDRTSRHGFLTARLAVPRDQAAAALGMSIDSFERYVQPELRLIRRGRIRVVPVRELERWLEENAEPPAREQLRGVR